MAQWTKEQYDAITNRGGALLVSAAAGSGKTAVLVERIVRFITEERQPVDRFLVVTYTNAAAAEMRGKIIAALTECLAQQPEDAFLRRQLFLVQKAQITTVHAFCHRLVREHFNQLELKPDFSIGEENTLRSLQQAAVEDCMEYAYGQIAGFDALADLLGGRDDSKLQNLIVELHEKLQSHARPEEFLDSMQAEYGGPHRPPAQTAWGVWIYADAQRLLQNAAESIEGALAAAASDPLVEEKYRPALAEDASSIARLAEAAAAGEWDRMVQAVSSTAPMRLGTLRSYENKALLDAIKSRREVWKTVLNTLREDYFCCTEEELRRERELLRPAMTALVQAVRVFADGYASGKRKKNLVDFHDLEHFALKLLITGQGEATPLAASLAFQEVLVDEYQDSNEVQDCIFSAVSGGRIFMVGDVKQSIYRFRLANPYIFLGKYRLFPAAESAAEGQERKIILSKNFRSRRQVIDSVNFIFAKLMRPETGEIAYTPAEYLYQGLPYKDEDHSRYDTELCVIDGEAFAGSEYEKEMPRLEAEYICDRICDMLNSGFPVQDKDTGELRKIQPGDVGVLFRTKGKLRYVKDALTARGIPFTAENDGGLMENTEIQCVLSLLAVTDNPQQDIPLIAALRSPLFGVDEDTLAAIRRTDKTRSFYDAFCQAAREDAALGGILALLQALRVCAVHMPVHQLLWEIYDRTDAMGVFGAMPGGRYRQKNLMQLFDIAQSADCDSLFQFMNLVYRMQESGRDFSEACDSTAGAGVRLMTIHKSKGLEMPVVFVADCGKKFNNADITGEVLLHPNYGVGAKYTDPDTLLRYSSVKRNMLQKIIRQESVSEELRVMYVGLTRAREKLVLVGTESHLSRRIQKLSAAGTGDKVPDYMVSNGGSMLSWLLSAALLHPAGQVLRESGETRRECLPAAGGFSVNILARYIPSGEPYRAAAAAPALAVELEPCREAYHTVLGEIPSKLTATGVVRETRGEISPLRRPNFDRERRGLTPAERGTAHHLAMQLLQFEVCGSLSGVESEIARLQQAGILSLEQGNAVDCRKLYRFFESGIYRELQQALEVRREFKFSILVPAKEYYDEAPGDETILMQGVVDCMFRTQEGYTVLDFKTDRIAAEEAAARAERYRPQLAVYSRAIEEIFGGNVVRRCIFFFETGQTVTV